MKRLMVVAAANAVTMCSFMSTTSAGMFTPDDFRVNMDWSNLGDLADYDAVPQIGYYASPSGTVKFEDNTWVLEGWRIWFLDDGTKPIGWESGTTFLTGRQPVGVFNTDDSGLYSMPINKAIRGDWQETPTVDEGACWGSPLTLIAQDLSDNRFYWGSILNGDLAGGYVAAEPGWDSWSDLQIDRNSPISQVPLPGALLLGLLGIGLTGLKLRRFA